jgi:hypothetical protein
VRIFSWGVVFSTASMAIGIRGQTERFPVFLTKWRALVSCQRSKLNAPRAGIGGDSPGTPTFLRYAPTQRRLLKRRKEIRGT